MSRFLSALPLVILVLLGTLVMGLDLGRSSLHNQDEALHAVVAREAAHQGRWLPLTYLGKPYYNKPPLRIWLTAWTFEVAGVDATTVRLWSALAGLATVLTLYLVGRRLWGERTGFLSALILLTSHQYIYNHCVRTGETDALLILCWTAGLLLLQLAVEEERPRVLLLAAVFLGLSGMVKHLGFVPVVLGIAIGYVILAGVWNRLPPRAWILGLLTALAVPLPWHLWMWGSQGQPFLQRYFLGEVIEKRLQASGGGPAQRPTGSWSSLATLARGFFPWSCLLPFAVLAVPTDSQWRRRWSLPFLWLVVAMALTVISGRKFSWYVLPAFPAAAILVGGLLARFLEAASPIWLRAAVLVGGVAALCSSTNAAVHNPFDVLAREAMLGVSFLGRLRGPGIHAVGTVGLVFALMAGLAAVHAGLRASSRPQMLRLVARALFTVSLVGIGLYTVLVPLRFSRTVAPIDEISRAVEAHVPAHRVLQVVLPTRKRNHPIFQFYLGDRRLRIQTGRDLALEELAGEFLLTDVATVNRFLGANPERVFPVPPIAQARGYLLFHLPPS